MHPERAPFDDAEQFKQTVGGRIVKNRFRLDWRWHRAKRIVDQGLPMSKYLDDDCVAYCREFIRAVRLGRPRAAERLQRKFPHLFLAWEIYNDDSPESIRGQIEAALLTEATAEQIGNFFAIDPIVPVMYENMFFNVRPFLSYSPGFAFNYVVRPAWQNAFDSRQQTDVMFKMLAYQLGWDEFSKVLLGVPVSDKAERIIDSVIELVSRLKAMCAKMVEPLTPYNTKDIMDTWVDIRKIAISKQLYQSTETKENEETAERVLFARPFRKRSQTDIEYDSGLELRAIDTMRKKESADGHQDPVPEAGE